MSGWGFAWSLMMAFCSGGLTVAALVIAACGVNDWRPSAIHAAVAAVLALGPLFL